ncbi:MAG: hypothetical protein LBC39_03235 [Methanobrevibacter sp.]|jgi:hypothetical protein|nr:hypothetical protein [Candidatus Methanovirga aequatorialis]
MLTTRVVNDGVNDVNTLIQEIVESLLNEIERETLAAKTMSRFKKHVKSVGLFGTKIEFILSSITCIPFTF